jgi:hypothetical protein
VAKIATLNGSRQRTIAVIGHAEDAFRILLKPKKLCHVNHGAAAAASCRPLRPARRGPSLAWTPRPRRDRDEPARACYWLLIASSAVWVCLCQYQPVLASAFACAFGEGSPVAGQSDERRGKIAVSAGDIDTSISHSPRNLPRGLLRRLMEWSGHAPPHWRVMLGRGDCQTEHRHF